MSKILIGSPVRQKNLILKEFLLSLEEIEKGHNDVSFYFVDDNIDDISSDLLRSFAKRNETIIKKSEDLYLADYDYTNHNWTSEILKKVTVYKNTIINYCIENEFDYLFLVDSDIVLDKRSLLQLISDNVDIVANVFWNQWRKNGQLTPQCFWIPDIYLQESVWNTPRPFEESHRIRMDMYNHLKKPGLYKVDGLGACTLITKHALEMGVNFTEIPNVKLLGEDRPFCIRAGVLGFDLYMDTYYPAYHISREIFLDRVEEFKKEGFKFDMCCTFEDDRKKVKPFPYARKIIVRIAKKVARDLSD